MYVAAVIIGGESKDPMKYCNFDFLGRQGHSTWMTSCREKAPAYAVIQCRQTRAYAMQQTRQVYGVAGPEKESDKLDLLVSGMQRIERSLKAKEPNNVVPNRDYEKRLARLEALVAVMMTVLGSSFVYSLTHPALIEVEHAHTTTRARVDVLEQKVSTAAHKPQLNKTP